MQAGFGFDSYSFHGHKILSVRGSLTVKYGGLTEPSRHHAAIVRYQSSLVILAVPLRLKTAQKRPFSTHLR